MAGCNDNCGMGSGSGSAPERRILVIALILNAGMFAAEFSAGLVAGSTALLADSLDMLADAMIYALGLFALGRASHWRARAALTSGLFQLVLGTGVAIEAVLKLSIDRLPDTFTMVLFGVLALIVNTISFVLLARFREGDINLRATWICSRNDMIGNVGVLVAAGLVMWLGSGWPDTLIGLLIAGVVIYSALKIGIEAYNQLQENSS